MMLPELTDGVLLAMLADPKQREQGFRLLMKLFGSKLYWHIRRMVIDHDDAEDVLQETSIKILENIQRFKGDSQLSTWLYRIANNEALMHLRRRTRWFQHIDTLAPELTNTLMSQADLDGDQTVILFQKAVLQLPTQQRIAFNLRYYDNMSYQEIADITGKTVTTLKSNYHHAVKKIEEYIKEHSI